LVGHPTVVGWLHTTARHAAINTVRGEMRRRTREQEAFAMQDTIAQPSNSWNEIRPLLDEAVAQLREADRQALMLRYFNGLSHQEIGAVLGLNENSANKRIERALDKLRAYFTRRGVTTTSAILATAISANSVQAAPVGLAEKSVKTAVAGAAGAGLSLALLSTLLFMNTKYKVALAVVLVAFLATMVIFNWPASGVSSPKAKQTDNAALNSLTLNAASKAPAAPVEAPKVAPAPAPAVSAPIPTKTAVADPQADLDSVISEMTTQLQTGNLLDVFKKFVSPRFLSMIPPDRLPQMEQMINEAMEDPASQNEMKLMILGLVALKTQTPKWNEAGDLATYTVVTGVTVRPPAGSKEPPTKKTLPLDVRFTKIDGKWYIASIPVNMYQENGKWHLTTQIGPSGVIEPMQVK
jgi:hypothetical protein